MTSQYITQIISTKLPLKDNLTLGDFNLKRVASYPNGAGGVVVVFLAKKNN